MNRVIKFRVWDKETAKWSGLERFIGEDYGDIAYNDEYVIQQFTGLTLPNGQEVYEGDILNSKAARWEVVFEDGAFYLKVVWSAVYPKGDRQLLSTLLPPLIPLGNCYESPDLLTV